MVVSHLNICHTWALSLWLNLICIHDVWIYLDLMRPSCATEIPGLKLLTLITKMSHKVVTWSTFSFQGTIKSHAVLVKWDEVIPLGQGWVEKQVCDPTFFPLQACWSTLSALWFTTHCLGVFLNCRFQSKLCSVCVCVCVCVWWGKAGGREWGRGRWKGASILGCSLKIWQQSRGYTFSDMFLVVSNAQYMSCEITQIPKEHVDWEE